MSLSVGMNLLTLRQLAGNERHGYDHDIIVEWSILFSSKELAPVCALETLLKTSFIFLHRPLTTRCHDSQCITGST